VGAAVRGEQGQNLGPGGGRGGGVGESGFYFVFW
jgi:hypothetical protein